jgi:hypothetical protein
MERCGLLLLVVGTCGCADAHQPCSSSALAAQQLAARVLGAEASRSFSFHALDNLSSCNVSVGPCCTVHAVGGMVQVNGTTAVTMAYCLAQYCKRELLMAFSWERSGGFQIPDQLPSPLPTSGLPLVLQKHCAPGNYGMVCCGMLWYLFSAVCIMSTCSQCGLHNVNVFSVWFA